VSVVAPAPATRTRPRRAPAAPPSPRTKIKGRKAPLARPRAGRSPVAPGVLWVLLVAALLGGIVALNVGALRNSIEASRVAGEVAALRSQNSDLQSQVAGQSGFGRISALAHHLGMVQAQPSKGDFLRLRPAKLGTAPVGSTTRPTAPAVTGSRSPAPRQAGPTTTSFATK
jgi:hypothetical protein